jgi:CHAD domain-containing protein
LSAKLEREVKLAAAPSFRLPRFDGTDGLTQEAREERLQRSTYYDTEDLRLARWGASLRYRDTDGWTVKLPTGGTGPLLVRNEARFDGGPKEPPHEAVDLVRAYVRTAPLAPVTRLKTLRRSVLVRGPDGEPAIEVVDDEVSIMDGRRLAARFRELEVEGLGDVTDELIDSIVVTLRAAGAGEPDPTPKYIRALGPRATRPPEVAVADLPSGATAGDVLRHAFAASVVRLIRHDAIVRLDGDPEGVHQARVATRRLRSDMRTFGTLLDPAWAASLVDDLRWLGGTLGEARDADVLLARLRGRLELLESVDTRAAGSVLERLASEREAAHRALLDTLRSRRYAEVLDRLVEAANAPAMLLEADLPAATVLPALLRRPWKKLRAAVRGLGSPPSDEQLHAVRIRAKRLRYAAEAVAPLMGKPARDVALAAADLQDELGEHNDAVVAGRWLRASTAGSRSVRGAFVAGELAGLERRAAADSRDRWEKAWRRLRHRWRDAWT